MTPALNDIRICVTDTTPAEIVAIGFGAAAEARAAQAARERHVAVNVLVPKDGFDLAAKISPSGMRVDVGNALRAP